MVKLHALYIYVVGSSIPYPHENGIPQYGFVIPIYYPISRIKSPDLPRHLGRKDSETFSHPPRFVPSSSSLAPCAAHALRSPRRRTRHSRGSNTTWGQEVRSVRSMMRFRSSSLKKKLTMLLKVSGWWCNNHLEKYEFVNGKDDIPYIMENRKWLKPPTRYNRVYVLCILLHSQRFRSGWLHSCCLAAMAGPAVLQIHQGGDLAKKTGHVPFQIPENIWKSLVPKPTSIVYVVSSSSCSSNFQARYSTESQPTAVWQVLLVQVGSIVSKYVWYWRPIRQKRDNTCWS